MNFEPMRVRPLRAAAVTAQVYNPQTFNRALAALVLAKRNGVLPIDFVEREWPDDHHAAWLTRSAVVPDSTTGSASALAPTRVATLLLIAPPSAAAKLFSRGMQLDFTGVLQYLVPHVGTHPVPLFVAEGAPIPFVQGSTAKAQVGPVKKLAFGFAISRELDESTPDSVAAILGRMLAESAAKSLDQYVFDAQPADATRPAGLLNGVSGLSSNTTVGQSSIECIAADISTFAGAFNAANINSENMVLICNPVEGWSIRMVRGFETMPLPVLMSPAIPGGQVIAVIPEAIASGYDGAPQIEVSKNATVHFEDTTPAQIGTVGTPNVVAAPTRSLLQQELIGVKLRVKCAWASLQPGAVQYMTGVRW